MTNPVLSFVLALSIALQPHLAFAAPKGQTSSAHKKMLSDIQSSASRSSCDKILYLEDLDISEELLEAVRKYVDSPKHRTSGKIVETVKSVFRWLAFPIRAITTIPFSKAVNYVRGDSKKPDESMFRVYRKKITVNNEDKEFVAFLVGVPHTMKTYDREKLDELASHFKRFGLPLMDPRIERKDFSLKFFMEEYSLSRAIFAWGHIRFMKLWNFVTKSSARWFLVNSTFKKFYSYPLYEDMKNLRIKSTDENGEVLEEKVRLEAREGQVIYLLNKHRPNIVESLDRLGSDARAATVMILMFSAIKDVLDTLDMGINHVSFYTTVVPIVTLVSSRMFAGFLNLLQDGKIPKLSVKNLYIVLKKLKHIFMSKVLFFMEKEKNNPSASAEELFERYKYTVEKDDYWRKALAALFGHEPIERDAAVVYQTDTIGKNIVTDAFKTLKLEREREREQEALNTLLPHHNHQEPLKGVKITLVYDTDKNLGTERTVEHNIEFDPNHKNLADAIDSHLSQTTDEPIFIMVPPEFMNGVHYQMIEKNGFQFVLSSRKPTQHLDQTEDNFDATIDDAIVSLEILEEAADQLTDDKPRNPQSFLRNNNKRD